MLLLLFRKCRGRDSDIDVIAEGLKLGELSELNPFDISYNQSMFRVKSGQQSSLQSLRDRILCPSLETLRAIAKPGIVAVAGGNFSNFRVPEYLDLGSEGIISQYEIEV